MQPHARPPARAIVLSAGLGERLRPMTKDRAKPSLPLMNRPIILHLLERLARGGVEQVAVNLHHAPGSLRQVLGESRVAVPAVTFSFEERILGTGGGVVAALGLLGGGAPVLVANGDALSDLDPGWLAERHREARAARAPATLAVRPRRPEDPYTPVWVDREGRLSGIGETGEKGTPHIFMGVQILEQEAIDRLPRRGPSDLVKDLYLPLLREGRRLGAALHEGWWIEIGSPRLYLSAHLDLLHNESFLSSLDAAAGALLPGRDHVFASTSAELAEGARAEESVLGGEVRVGPGVVVRRSLLGRGASILEGASVEDCVVWEGARVEAGERLRGTLVTPGEPGGRLQESLR